LWVAGLSCAYAEDLPDPVSDGAGFFVLSDRSYGPDEVAQVRVEAKDVQAVHDHGGVEIALYQVPHPIDFLKAQTNLHRINVQAVPAKHGLWNAIVAIWDQIARSTRLLWRALFSEDARSTSVATAPDLRQRPDMMTGHPQVPDSAYQPLPGFNLVSRFRYPVQFGQDITPPSATLEGANVGGMITTDEGNISTTPEAASSASVTTPAPMSNGNVEVPLGKLTPGLYLVEAMVGEQRAVTLVFVGRSVAVSKITSDGLLVWTVDRITGSPVADVDVHWNDGTADLASGHTGATGWLQMAHSAPEKTYVYAQDSQGGVLISENYYYDSEIYNTKLYATTDRPLYHAGDTVQIKVVGREFINARDSKGLTSGPIQIQVMDPNGLPVAQSNMTFDGQTGGQSAIRLPEGSVSGGYEIQLTYRGEVYSAAFRVADFQKPHFEINLDVDSKQLKTKQEIPATIQLRYPDGKPVKNAQIDLDLKAQSLSMVEGDLGYGGLFPVKLTSQQYTSDSSGNVAVKLPAVKEPSRYVVSVLATDGAAYRVRHTQELLIERASSTWVLDTPQRFSAVNQPITLTARMVAQAQTTTANASKPVRWKAVRLEDGAEESHDLNGNRLSFTPSKSGSYVISLLDSDGSVLGATSHWVSGPELKVPTGHIEIVWDKDHYQVGDTASGLVTFSEPVDQALVTLERDQIEGVSLMASPAAWLTTERLSPTQWRVRVPVSDHFAPNITLSVAYVKQNQFVFENAGIVVASPAVDVRVTPDKAQYAPGEQVHLTVQTMVAGQPVPASVSLGVVDEMIYVLQPEIAPDIHEFFYHPRRNNVRTQYSASFIGYDLSTNLLGQDTSAHTAHERAIKVLERPRRDNVDTAYWAPQVTTDATGRAVVSFTMPDALSRWRITARAMTADGIVGQSKNYINSHKDLYLKWTSPRWLRPTDQATSNLAIFNETSNPQNAVLTLSGALNRTQNVTVQPGINFVDVARTGADAGELTIGLTQQGQVRDRLAVNLTTQSSEGLTHYDRLITPSNGQLTLGLPVDARNVNLRFLESPRAGFYRVMDNLIDQPFGCVEQTASRLIPLALAYQALPADDPRRADLARQLYTQRLRLASMAGDEAKFGWWGSLMPADAFLTTYAYYADWRTAQALGLTLPDDHWQRLLDLYSEDGAKYPHFQRALMLDWMRQIGLPVGSMAQGLARDELAANKVAAARYGSRDSLILTDASSQTEDMAFVLTAHLLKATNQSAAADWQGNESAAIQRLQANPSLLSRALLLSQGAGATGESAGDLLAAASSEYATIDRAVMLTWLDQGLSAVAGTTTAALPAPWTSRATRTGMTLYVWPNPPAHPAANTPVAPLPPLLPSTSSAVISYDSAIKSNKITLPATLVHELYLLKPQSDGSFDAEKVGKDDTLHTDALYLDRYTLTTQQPLHYMVVEAPLPAGATVESGTWGVKVKDMDSLPKANYQDLSGRYVVPVGEVSEPAMLEHLMRFSQRGRYVLPAAHAYNMYRPDAQVVEQSPRTTLVVE